MTAELAAILEPLSLAAHPPLETVPVGGWLVGISGGRATNRANSVHLLGDAAPVVAAIEACEAIYRDRGQRAAFKVTPLAPPAVDLQLAARGYRRHSPTVVCTAPLAPASTAGAAASDVTLAADEQDGWLTDHARLVGLGDDVVARAMIAEYQAVLGGVTAPRAHARRRVDGAVVAVGYAVADAGWVGIYGMASDRAQRRRGHGRAILAALLAWGRERGATQAYLQVGDGNAAALGLYAGAGFTPGYPYWYRVAP